jgi:hypothetical protein
VGGYSAIKRQEVSMGRFADAAERVMAAIEGQQWLDVPSYKIEHGYALLLNLMGEATDRVRNGLHGTWLGHPVHPVLTDIPVGAWTAALVLDLADASSGRDRRAGAACTCIAVGLAGASAAAVTGATDWQYTHDNARRMGLVHGTLNLAATGLYAGSWRARRHGRT